MSENAYRPGTWTAVVSPSFAVFVDELPNERRRVVWQAVSSGADVDDIIRAVTGGTTSGIPPFGLVLRDGDCIRVLVRAGVSAVVTDAGGIRRSIDSGGVSTNIEYVADEVTAVTLGRSGVDSGTSLPILGGIVLADAVLWHPPADEDEVTAPPLAATGQRRATEKTATRIMIDEVPASHQDDEQLADETVVTVGSTPHDELDLAKGGYLAAEADGEVNAAYVDLGREGDHDGYTVTRMTINELRADAAVTPLVQAVSCSLTHLNPPEAFRCRICDEFLDQQEPVLVPRPSLGHLRFSTGQVVELDSRVVVGRSPSAERVSAGELPQLVQVESPAQDISRSHVEVRLDGWRVEVVDLDSVNGTVVALPGRDPERLQPGEPYPLVPNAVIDLAGEVTFRYAPAQ
ncbi:MAG: FHA domain-containing protein [Mycobacteriales bacterium]